jgi:ribonuclease-3
MKAQRLEAALGHGFGRPELLRQALTHRSFGSPPTTSVSSSSATRCSIAPSPARFTRFPALKEGELSRLRASLVRQETLADIARDLALGEFLQLGEGELKSGGAQRPSILADALEAIFGAIYVDAGFERRAAVETALPAGAEPHRPSDTGKDPKTALQELLQGRRLPLPRYALLATRGEAHAQEFEVECAIPELGIRSTGSGGSRRIAEQQAAQRAIAEIKP